MVALRDKKKLEKDRKERARKRRKALITFGLVAFALIVGLMVFGVTKVAQNNRQAITQEGIRSLSYSQYTAAEKQLKEGSEAGEPTAAAFLAWMKISMGYYDDALTYAQRAMALEELSSYEILGDLALLGKGTATGPIAALSFFEQGAVKIAAEQANLLSKSKKGTDFSLTVSGNTELGRFTQIHDANDDGLLDQQEAANLATDLFSHMVNRSLSLASNADDYHTLLLNAGKKGVKSLVLPLGDMMFLGNERISSNSMRAVEYWQEAQEAGVQEAVTRMAGAYWHGYSIARDPKKAIDLYHQAAGFRDPVAFYALGLIALRKSCDANLGANRDRLIQEALNYFSQASSLGYGPASTLLGVFSLTESNATEDMQKGVKWLEIAALEQGDIAGRVIYDLLQITGTGIRVNFTAGFDDLLLIAKTFKPAQSIVKLLRERQDPGKILSQVLVCANQVIKGNIAYREGDPVYDMVVTDPVSGKSARRPFDFYNTVTTVPEDVKYRYGLNNFCPVTDLSRLHLNGEPLLDAELAKVIIQYNPSTGTESFVADMMMPRPMPPITPVKYNIGTFVPPAELLAPAPFYDGTGAENRIRAL